MEIAGSTSVRNTPSCLQWAKGNSHRKKEGKSAFGRCRVTPGPGDATQAVASCAGEGFTGVGVCGRRSLAAAQPGRLLLPAGTWTPAPPQQGTVAARTSHAPASTEARLNALLGRPPMVCARCPHQGGHLHPPVETLWFLQCRRRARCPTVSPALPRESLCPAATSPARLCWPLGEQNWWSGLTGYIYWNCSWQSSQAGRTRCRDGECPFLSRPQPQGLNGGK